jgi:hypothetical protein
LALFSFNRDFFVAEGCEFSKLLSGENVKAIVRGKNLLRDKILGVLFLSLALFGMVAYFWLVFLSPQDVTYAGKTISEWAVIIPVILIVFIILFLVAWIGWALASTAPPLPVSEDDSED